MILHFDSDIHSPQIFESLNSNPVAQNLPCSMCSIKEKEINMKFISYVYMGYPTSYDMRNYISLGKYDAYCCREGYMSYGRAMMSKSYVQGPSRYKTGVHYVDKTFFDDYI